MDNMRLIVAVVLSILVFVVWDYFFVDKTKRQEPSSKPKTEQVAKQEPPVAEKEKKEVARAPAAVKAPEVPERPTRTITVDTPLYTAKIAEEGAVFKSFVLKQYREKIKKESAFYEMVPPQVLAGTMRLGLAGKSLAGLDDAAYFTDLKPDAVEIRDKAKEISFFWNSPEGFVVEKKFSFSPETYLIGLDVSIGNTSGREFKDKVVLSLVNPAPDSGTRIGFEGPSALIGNELEEVKTKNIEDQNVYSGKVKWVAIEGRYFMSSIIPETPEDADMRLFLTENGILENQYVHPESVIGSGSRRTFKHFLFLGPKSMKVLSGLGYDLDKAVDFGMFDFLAKPLLWIMNFLYDYTIPNYGIAIIFLTILTKVVLWPLGTKSYKSMNEMKKIQPLMAEVREKYGNDKKKMNEELMSLYKTYKINPLGGCLPMVVQIPVFFALYRMLYEAIELRHAPFFGWINDLSAPDRLFRFDFAVPFMEPPYGVPVLTVVMGATMLLQQKMSPPPGDPTQAKMMMLMPIVFTFIFINFSSGLVLYWLVNNVLSIGQQYYVSKK